MDLTWQRLPGTPITKDMLPAIIARLTGGGMSAIEVRPVGAPGLCIRTRGGWTTIPLRFRGSLARARRFAVRRS